MTNPDNNTENTKDNEASSPLKDEWLIRRCTTYDEEYCDCTSFKARFNQYFIYGKTIDCSQWKRDAINCYKWTENKDLNAGKEIIDSEKHRRKERLLPHYQNTVWVKRRGPPEDWNKPLPEYLQKEYETSYLHVKARELRGEIPPSFDPNIKFCNIL